MPSKRISRPIAGRLSLLGVWCIAPMLGAGEPVQLEPIVVTATLEAEDPLNLPYTTSTVEEDAIRVERAARTLPQAIAEVPAVSLQKTAQGMESPYIRGFTGFRTLLLVDGIGSLPTTRGTRRGSRPTGRRDTASSRCAQACVWMRARASSRASRTSRTGTTASTARA